MFNLFVAYDPQAWDGEPWIVEQDRVLASTSDRLRERLLPLGDEAIEELTQYPALFAHEKASNTPAKIGRIERIRVRPDSVQIRYELLDLPTVSPEQIEALAWDLDIGAWEMNRTHWALKDVDLGEALQEAGILDAGQLSAIDGALFPQAVPEAPYEITPKVFRLPDQRRDASLVTVMMPFSAEFEPVFQALQRACEEIGLQCLNANQVWEESEIIQDVFGLIYRSAVVICDFTNRNPNVFYEAGIAHTLGRPVIPITQNKDHVPFDVGAHRYAHYLPNAEGLAELQKTVQNRLATLTRRGR